MWNFFLVALFSEKKTLMRNFKGLLTVSSHQSEALSGWALLSICTSRPSIHFLFPHLLWPPIPPQTLVGEAPCDGGQAFFICQQLEPWGPGILRPPDARAWSPEAMSEPTVSQWLLLAFGYHFPFVSDGQTDRQWDLKGAFYNLI